MRYLEQKMRNAKDHNLESLIEEYESFISKCSSDPSAIILRRAIMIAKKEKQRRGL
jgi:hypothetical protein